MRGRPLTAQQSTLAELFTAVRRQLVAAIEEAAARPPTQRLEPQVVRMSKDVGATAPSIVLHVHDTVASASEMVDQLDYLQHIMDTVLEGARACCEWCMACNYFA